MNILRLYVIAKSVHKTSMPSLSWMYHMDLAVSPKFPWNWGLFCPIVSPGYPDNALVDVSSLTPWDLLHNEKYFKNFYSDLLICDPLCSLTAPVAPEITSVEYFNSLLYVSWTYGDDTTDLSHSRMLHWMVIAEGKKKIKKSVCFLKFREDYPNRDANFCLQ